MKQRHVFAAALIAAMLAACGGGETEVGEEAPDAPKADLERANVEAREAGPAADERPLHLACNEPGFTPGQLETYVGLHSPLYPSVVKKGEFLLAEAQTVNPQPGDEDVHDIEAYEAVTLSISALAQWRFVMGVDVMPQGIARMCDVSAYDDDDACSLARRMLRQTGAYKDIDRNADGLSYTLQMNDGTVAKIFMSNEDRDHVTFNQMSKEGSFSGEWIRAADGTETHRSRGTTESYDYVERPDCSGQAKVTRKDSFGHPASWAWTWTSVKEERFSMTYTRCVYNRVTEESDCTRGSF